MRLGGTLGDPNVDGEFHMRDGRFDLYRTNLSLTDANLDGRFAGDYAHVRGPGDDAQRARSRSRAASAGRTA